MYSAGKRRRQTLMPICYIDMTSFLSVQLVLLFMFMVVASDRPDLPSNTTANPRVGHAVPMRGALREDALVVAVQRTGDVWLGYKKLSADQLPVSIHEAVRRGAENKVYIKADGRAKYGQVREVLAAVRSAGVEKVGFLVYQRQTNSNH
jgi:biopolymer transport protein TolR